MVTLYKISCSVHPFIELFLVHAIFENDNGENGIIQLLLGMNSSYT